MKWRDLEEWREMEKWREMEEWRKLEEWRECMIAPIDSERSASIRIYSPRRKVPRARVQINRPGKKFP